MKKHAALWGLFATLAVCWGSASDAEPEKVPRMKRSFAQRPITSSAESTGWTARPCAIAWTATVERCHMAASRHSLMPERCQRSEVERRKKGGR